MILKYFCCVNPCMLDIFDSLDIPEIIHHGVIIVMSSLVALVTWYYVPHFGVDNCP